MEECPRRSGTLTSGPQCVCSNLQLLIVSPGCEVDCRPAARFFIVYTAGKGEFICSSFEQLMRTRFMPTAAVYHIYAGCPAGSNVSDELEIF